MAVLAQIPSFLTTYIIPYFFMLSLVVFIHEMGHFPVGRWCGVTIDAFSLGFGPELLHYVDRRGTRWRLAALPLGGYVKFHGDLNGASMMDGEAAAAMSDADRAVTFFHQKVWKRAAIVVAGPVANFILAFVIFAGVFFFNGTNVPNPNAVVGSVQPNSPAESAGLKAQDTILSINGQPIQTFEDLHKRVQESTGPLTLSVRRQAETLSIVATPRDSKLGIQSASTHQNAGLVDSATMGATQIGSIVTTTGSYLGNVLLGHVSAREISGPIGIAEVSGEMAKRGVATFLFFIGVISVSVGILNLLPIPLLDGGHLMYYAFEAAKGKALRERTQEFGFRVGLTFVAAIMLLAFWNDISRHM